ncbi:MAG: arsenite efflux transporter metallochaperone ArsD [Pseudomonadota bacterium]
MPHIKVYDSALCCATGVCGPDADDELAQFAAALEWAKKNGANVDRFNLSHQPGAFAEDTKVKGLLESDGMECLPLIYVDEDLLAKGAYPSRTVIAEKLGLEAPAEVAESSGCCGPKEEEKAAASSGCCS